MHRTILEKRDAVDAAGAPDAPDAPGNQGAAGAAVAAGNEGAAVAAVVEDTADAASAAGAGEAGLTDLQMLLSESSRPGGAFRSAQWDRSPTGDRPVKSPQVLRKVPPRVYGEIVGERRDSMASGRAEDSDRTAAQASTAGPGCEDSSDDGGSKSVGIGQRFADPKPIGIPPKLYRIGEIVEHSGLSRQTIHNYTTMGLLVEARRTDGGHRLYDESVFERLNGIIALKAQHKSLAYIREYYAKSGAG